jgi:hypothetical protein
MKIIAVAGASSKAGKTVVAEQIIHYCAARYSPVYGVKFTTTSDIPSPCPRGAPCTVCDLSDRFRIVTDGSVINQPGKNTARLLHAGANKVLWVVSRKSEIATAYKHLLTHLPEDSITVMEGSTITSLSKPDLLFYVIGRDIPASRWKENAREILRTADFAVMNSRRETTSPFPLLREEGVRWIEGNLLEKPVTADSDVQDKINELLRSLSCKPV